MTNRAAYYISHKNGSSQNMHLDCSHLKPKSKSRRQPATNDDQQIEKLQSEQSTTSPIAHGSSQNMRLGCNLHESKTLVIYTGTIDNSPGEEDHLFTQHYLIPSTVPSSNLHNNTKFSTSKFSSFILLPGGAAACRAAQPLYCTDIYRYPIPLR